jgi:hypothetical protein
MMTKVDRPTNLDRYTNISDVLTQLLVISLGPMTATEKGAAGMRNWRAETAAVRRLFPNNYLHMNDCDIVDLLKEFRTVNDAISYLSSKFESGI